jgi:hypothetical protein
VIVTAHERFIGIAEQHRPWRHHRLSDWRAVLKGTRQNQRDRDVGTTLLVCAIPMTRGAHDVID